MSPRQPPPKATPKRKPAPRATPKRKPTATAKAKPKPAPKAKPKPAPKATPKPSAYVPTTPGTLLAAPLHDGRWTAYQVIADDGGSAALLSLDSISDAPPTLDDLADVKPLHVDHHSWRGGLSFVNVDPPRPPRTWRSIGVRAPLLDHTPNAYGGWPGGVHQVVLQRRWETEIPAAARAAYKACTTSRDTVTVELGGFTLADVRRDRSEVSVGESDAPIAAGTPIRWLALDALPHLTRLALHGRFDEPALLAYLRAHPMIEELSWRGHGLGRLDLSSTRLTEVSLGTAEPFTVRLPDSVRELSVYQDPAQLTVEDPHAGARLHLLVTKAGLPRGLRGLRSLRVSHVATVDLAAIAAAFPELVGLEVFGETVDLIAPERLAALPHLRDLELIGCYGLDVTALPPAATWPDLDRVVIDGHRKEDAAELRARLGGAPRFELRGGKTADWLAANLGNPFRDWVDRDARAGKVSTAAWRKAKAALTPAPARRQIETVLKAFLAAFAKLDIADTVDREEIFEAFVGLAEGAGIDGDTAEGWWGAWEDF